MRNTIHVKSAHKHFFRHFTHLLPLMKLRSYSGFKSFQNDRRNAESKQPSTIGRVSRGQVKELGRLDFAQTVDTGDHIADKSGKGDLTRTRDARPREKVN